MAKETNVRRKNMKKLLAFFAVCLVSLSCFGASGIYDGFMADMAGGLVDWDTDTLKIALLSDSHTFTASDDTWADVSANEV